MREKKAATSSCQKGEIVHWRFLVNKTGFSEPLSPKSLRTEELLKMLNLFVNFWRFFNLLLILSENLEISLVSI